MSTIHCTCTCVLNLGWHVHAREPSHILSLLLLLLLVPKLCHVFVMAGIHWRVICYKPDIFDVFSVILVHSAMLVTNCFTVPTEFLVRVWSFTVSALTYSLFDSTLCPPSGPDLLIEFSYALPVECVSCGAIKDIMAFHS